MVRLFFLTLLLIVGMAACQPTTLQPAAPVPAMAKPDQLPVLPNLLVFKDARVEVRRKDGLTPVPVTVGAELQPGDVVMVKEGQAAIFCGAELDWETNPPPLTLAKPAGVPCGVGRPPRPYPDATIVRARGGGEADTGAANDLYVLSPRSGWVLNDRPTLVWHEVAGATSYTVTLESDDELIRTTVAAGSPLPYPAEWEPLQGEGASYRLLVQTTDQSSGAKTPGFSLVENQQAILGQIERLRQRPLEDPARSLLLAELYLSYSLRSEAIDLLTALSDADQIIAVQSLLGETYLNMGLVAEGQAAYTRMLTLAQTDGFPESQAQALVGLGFAACAVAAPDAAQQHWLQASELYDQYSLTAQAETVQTLLVEGTKQCN